MANCEWTDILIEEKVSTKNKKKKKPRSETQKIHFDFNDFLSESLAKKNDKIGSFWSSRFLVFFLFLFAFVIWFVTSS